MSVSLAEEYEEQYAESRVTGQTFRAAGHPSPSTPTEPSPRPPPSKRLEFVLMVSPGLQWGCTFVPERSVGWQDISWG